MIGFIGATEFIQFIGDGGGGSIDPAFLVTVNGETVTNSGAPVTYGTDIDPALLVLNDGSVVTNSGAIVLNGE